MATDAKAGCSKQVDSSEVQEYICGECFKSGKRTEASHYCPSCDTFYCKPCLCDHDVLGRSNVQQWGSSKRRKTEELCVRHPHEAVLLFCKSHDELCCQLCLSSVRHRFCKEKVELTSIRDEIPSQTDNQNILNKLSRLTIKAETLKEDRHLRCKTVDSTYNVCLKRIGEFRKSVNSAFDEIEMELSKCRESYIGTFKGDQNICDNALAALGQFQQRLSDAAYQHTVYDLKQCKDWANYTYENLTEMNKVDIQDTFVPIELSDVESSVQAIKKLGEIKLTFHSFSAKTDGDTDTCVIGGMCQMPDGSIIITDTKNKKLKKFDTEYKAIGQYEFESCPLDVCCINDTKVAVAMDDRKIQFVSTVANLEVTKFISVEHNIYNIAYFKDMLYSCRYGQNPRNVNCVCVYDMSGTVITASNDVIGVCFGGVHVTQQSLFTGYNTPLFGDSAAGSVPSGIPVVLCKNDNYCKIYAVLEKKDLIVFNIEGTKIKELHSRTLRDQCAGVCVDEEGLVHVSYSKNNKVVALDNMLKTFVRSTVVPQTPGRLFYDRRHARKLVACLNGDTVFVI